MTLGAALLAPQPLAAMIAGGFVALGWVTTHVLSIRRDRAQRAERVRDVQGALYAEIRVYTDTLESQRLATYGAEIEAQILGRPGFFPVIPTENNDRIFAAIVEEMVQHYAAQYGAKIVVTLDIHVELAKPIGEAEQKGLKANADTLGFSQFDFISLSQ